MNRESHHSSVPKAIRLAPLAAALLATPAFAESSPAVPAQGFVLAYVTLKDGMVPSKKPAYTTALQAACGELGVAANSKSVNAKVVGDWSNDQYTNQDDPKTNPVKKYGNHLTVETFDGPSRTGRWHLYESGAVFVDRKGDGMKIDYSCNK